MTFRHATYVVPNGDITDAAVRRAIAETIELTGTDAELELEVGLGEDGWFGPADEDGVRPEGSWYVDGPVIGVFQNDSF